MTGPWSHLGAFQSHKLVPAHSLSGELLRGHARSSVGQANTYHVMARAGERFYDFVRKLCNFTKRDFLRFPF